MTFPQYIPDKPSIEVNQGAYEKNIMSPKISNAPTTSSLSTVFKEYTDNVGSFRPYMGLNSNPFIGENPASYETRARQQSGGQLLGNSIAQFFLGEFVGGTVSGVGTLSRPDKWVARVLNTTDAYERTLIEEFGNWIMEETRNKFPIYQTMEAQKGAAFTDASWYASMAPSVASALSILIPARAAAILPVKVGNYLSKSRVLKAADTAQDLAKISRYSNAEHLTTMISSAVAGRVIDSTRESLNRYSDYYQENLSKGMTASEAKQEAADAAAKGFRMSHLNIVFDLVQWGTILKMGNYAKKGYVENLKRLLYRDSRYKTATGLYETGTKRISGLALDMFKTGISEGADEMTMDFFQNEGKYQHDIEHDKVKRTNVEDRINKQLSERKSWDSFIGGVAGGLFMMPFGKLIEVVGNRKGVERMKEQANAIIEHAESNRKIIEQINSAIENGDAKQAQILKDNLISNIASNSYVNGSLDHDVEMFSNLINLSPERLKEEGIHPDAVEYLKDIHSNISLASKIFDTEMDKISIRNDDGSIHEANFAYNYQVAKLKTDIAINNKRLDEARNNPSYNPSRFNIEGTETIFGQLGKEYLQTLANNHIELIRNQFNQKSIKDQISALESAIKEHENTVASSTNKLSKFAANAKITGIKGTIESLKQSYNQLVYQESKLKEDGKIKLSAYEGLDANNNPLLDDNIKSQVNDYFNKNFKENLEQDEAKQVVMEYTSMFTMLNNALVHILSKNYINDFIDNFQQYQTDHIADIESQIDEEVDQVNTIEELDNLQKKYKKAFSDEKLYKSKIAARRTKIKNQERAKAEDARRNEANANAAANAVAQNTSATNSSSLRAEPSQTQTESATNPAAFALAKVFKLNNIKRYNEFKQAITELNTQNTMTDEEINHMSVLYDIIFNDKNIDLIAASNPEVKIDVKSFIATFITSETPTNDFSTILFKMYEAVIRISDDYGIVESSDGKFELVGGSDFKQNFDDLIETLNSLNPDYYKNAKTGLADYTAAFGTQFSSIYEGLDNGVSDQNVASQLSINLMNTITNFVDVDFKSRNNEDNYFLFRNSNIHDTLDYFSQILKDVIRSRTNATGTVPSIITFKDVLKYLRDIDVIKERYEEAFFALSTYKNFLDMRIGKLNKMLKSFENDKANKTKVPYIKKELERLSQISNIIQIGKVNTETLSDEVIDKFIKTNPKLISKKTSYKGTKTILNTYDENGEEIEIETTDITILDNERSIYNALSSLKENAEVVFEIDTNYRHKNSPVDYDWGTQPIRVKLKDGDKVGKSTALFIRALTYLSGGIQYGRKENGDYVFHGVSEALNESDYLTLEEAFDTIRSFYYNYRQTFSNNIKENTRDRYKANMNKMFNQLEDNDAIKEIILKVVNQNLDAETTISDLSMNEYVGFFDSLFYGVNLEDLEESHSYMPDAAIIKNKIFKKDVAYYHDFNNTKSLRSGIHSGLIKESKIANISTPPVLHLEDQIENGVPKPRHSMDLTIKPITLNTDKPGSSPRIVLIKEYDNEFYDLETGQIITDPRFDKSGYLYKMTFNEGTTSGIKVLLEAPNGKLIPYNVHANTIGASYSNDIQRTEAIETVANFIDTLLTPSSKGNNAAEVDYSKHITVYDQHLSKENALGHTKDYNYLESFSNDKESRVTIAVPYNGKLIFNNIVKTGTIINIYRSKYKVDVIKRTRTTISKSDDFNIDISTKEGRELYERKVRELVPLMIRQSHIDHVNHKFTFGKDYKGGEIVDQITGETYKNATELFIKTGAIYSRANAVYDNNGNIVTNFDIRGRYPMVVTIDHTFKEFNTKYYQTVYDSIGHGKLIEEDDTYIDLIRMLAKATEDSVSFIQVNPTDNPSNRKSVALTNRDRKSRFNKRSKTETVSLANTYSIQVFNPFFEKKSADSKYFPSSLYIAHELLHVYMNKRYARKNNESESTTSARHERILYHNEQMTDYVNQLTSSWNNVTDKTTFMMNIFNIDMEAAEKFVKNFEKWISYINEDVTQINSIVKNAVDNNMFLEHTDTIQEPITYAYTSPFITMVLNNITYDGDINIKKGKKKSIWNLLLDKLFSILQKLFVNDTNLVELNNQNQLAKLHSLVNEIFDARLRAHSMSTSESIQSSIVPIGGKAVNEDVISKPEVIEHDTSDINIDDIDFETMLASESDEFIIPSSDESIYDVPSETDLTIKEEPKPDVPDINDKPVDDSGIKPC